MKEFYLYWEASDLNLKVTDKGNFLLMVDDQSDFLTEIDQWKERLSDSFGFPAKFIRVVSCTRIN